MKTCVRCKKTFPLDMFYKNAKNKDGKTIYCKSCAKEKSRNHHRLGSILDHTERDAAKNEWHKVLRLLA